MFPKLNIANDFSTLPISENNALSEVTEQKRLFNERLNKLCAIQKESWCGYESHPVSYTNADFARQIVENFGEKALQEVSLNPTSSGELLLQWETEKGEVELLILRPCYVEASFFPRTGEQKEEILSSDFTVAQEWIEKILSLEDISSAA